MRAEKSCSSVCSLTESWAARRLTRPRRRKVSKRDVARGLDRVAHAAPVDGGMFLEGRGGFLGICQSFEFTSEAAEFLGDVGQRTAGGGVGVDPPDDQREERGPGRTCAEIHALCERVAERCVLVIQTEHGDDAEQVADLQPALAIDAQIAGAKNHQPGEGGGDPDPIPAQKPKGTVEDAAEQGEGDDGRGAPRDRAAGIGEAGEQRAECGQTEMRQVIDLADDQRGGDRDAGAQALGQRDGAQVKPDRQFIHQRQKRHLFLFVLTHDLHGPYDRRLVWLKDGLNQAVFIA